MSRVPAVVPDELDADQRRLFDQIMATRHDGQIQGPSALWVRSASIGTAASQMAATLRRDSKLEACLFELITLIVARQWSTHYVWHVHAKEAERVGLAPAIIEALRSHRVPHFDTEQQTMIYEMSQELLATKQLADATYGRALAMFGAELIVEIVTTIGFYTLVCMTLNAFRAPAPGNALPLA